MSVSRHRGAILDTHECKLPCAKARRVMAADLCDLAQQTVL